MEAYIIDAVRTPIGKGKPEGAFAQIRPDDLLALVLKETLRRTAVDSQKFDDVICGCVTQCQEQGVNVTRIAALLAGFPVEVPGTTVTRLCGSSQQAFNFAAQGIMAGQYDLVVAGGIESMSRVPMGSDMALFSDTLLEKYPIVPQGLSAEMVAQRWELSRGDVDRLSHQSHVRAIRAQREGRFAREILPVTAPGPDGASRVVDRDEGPRADANIEKMGTLRTVFKPDGVVTAGNSSQISDGAAAIVLASAKAVKAHNLQPRARVVSMAVAGVDPVIMLTGPIPATRKALERARLRLSDVDLIEINEAFATVVLACGRDLGFDPFSERVNPNGGAVALGHPLGASGARLLTTLLHEMERTGARYGLSTMCIGFGQGITTIIERMA